MSHGGTNQDGSIIQRVSRLPLVHSAFQIVTFAYQDVKGLHPAVGFVCDVSERGVKALGGAASFGASPLLKLVEPQVAVVNSAAVRVVDELEERLPFLDQAADEVASDLRNTLVSNVSAVRARVVGRAQEAMSTTQTLVRDVYEATSMGVLSLGTLGVRELVRLGADLAVSRAEDLRDHYLPEDDGEGVESSGSEEADDVDESGLVSRVFSLVGSIGSRGFHRLSSTLDQVWVFIHGVISFASDMPSQLKRSSDTIMEALFVQKVSTEDPKQKVTPKKSQATSPYRSGRALNRRRLTPPSGGVSIFRVFTNDKQVLTEIDRARAQARERRRQSLDSSLIPSQIQEV